MVSGKSAMVDDPILAGYKRRRAELENMIFEEDVKIRVQTRLKREEAMVQARQKHEEQIKTMTQARQKQEEEVRIMALARLKQEEEVKAMTQARIKQEEEVKSMAQARLKQEEEVKTMTQTRITKLKADYVQLCEDTTMDERASLMFKKKILDILATEGVVEKVETKADTKHFFAGLAREDPSVSIQNIGARELYTKYTEFHALAVHPKLYMPMTETAFGREIKNISGVNKKRTNASAVYTLNFEMISQAQASS
jgi:hypothetical protein